MIGSDETNVSGAWNGSLNLRLLGGGSATLWVRGLRGRFFLRWTGSSGGQVHCGDSQSCVRRAMSGGDQSTHIPVTDLALFADRARLIALDFSATAGKAARARTLTSGLGSSRLGRKLPAKEGEEGVDGDLSRSGGHVCGCNREVVASGVDDSDDDES